jgi:predicted RNA-binding Zn-ribbon protein involved in translation (DUF1610 family)
MATSALSANRTSQCYVRGEQVSSLVKIAEVNFICPHCASLYEIVRADAPPDSVEYPINCSSCHGPLPAREEQFVLRYFLMRRLGGEMWERLPVIAAAS